jgi:hypothetical protein
MMIKDLFKAKNPHEEGILDLLLAQIGTDPNIAWYPSAGLDFRDLIEVNRTKIEPDIFFHTDYNTDWVRLKCGELFNDDRTSVLIERITELKFRRPIHYSVNTAYIDFPDDASPTPKIYLLDVKVESSKGQVNKPVLYFFMENINFLDEVLLRKKIKLSHFIKVREGCGLGGNRKSISITYAFLGELLVQHILVDHEEDTDKELIASLLDKHQIKPKKYELKNAAQKRNISNWSDFNVKVFDVQMCSGEVLSNDDLNQILQKIKT